MGLVSVEGLRHVTCDMFAPDLSSSAQFCFFKQKPKDTEEEQVSLKSRT